MPEYSFRIVNSHPHSLEAFTQGLAFVDGWLYEGTGLKGRSTVRKVELETGKVVQTHELPPQFFGEGLTVLGDKIYQLTWQSNTGFVYDRESFQVLRAFHYPTEGWGLTHDGKRLMMSDGTATIHFLDPNTLNEIGQIQVTAAGTAITRLNELEFFDEHVYANIWQTDLIAKIDPGTGQVTAWINLTGILSLDDYTQPVDVLNGIAYDAEQDRLFVTGKLWPRLFEIEIVE